MAQKTSALSFPRRRVLVPLWIIATFGILFSSIPLSARVYPRVEFLNLRDADIKDAARLLASLTDAKIIATPKTAGLTVDLFVRDADVSDCLKLICRSTGLVYRYDEESDIFTIMTLEEYRQNVQVDTEGLYQIKVFSVEPANVTQIARAIESLFPDQVIFTEGEPIENFGAEPGTTGGGGSVGSNFGDSDRRTSDNNRRFSDNGRMGGFGGVGSSATTVESRRRSTEQITAEEALAASAGTLLGVPENAAKGLRNGRAKLGPADASIFVTTNLEHNQFIVRTANDTAMRQIEKLVPQLNRPVPQVILEMKILNLNVGNGRQIGVDFGLRNGKELFEASKRDPVTGVPTEIQFLGRANQIAVNLATQAAAGFAYTYLSRNIQARVQLLATNNDVEVVATPVLIATNNRPAKIEVGEQRIVTVGASTDTAVAGETGTRNELITLETEKRTIGVTLEIRPRINEDGTVTLFVEQESTTLKPRNNRLLVGRQEVLIDSVDTANISATVVARSGNTIAVGGLIRNESSNAREKVPILGDIPVVGKLFGRESIGRNKSELILLITPTIIDGGRRATAKTDEIVSGLDHSYPVAGEAFIETKNAELHRYRFERDTWLEQQEQLLIEQAAVEQSVAPPPATGKNPVRVRRATPVRK